MNKNQRRFGMCRIGSSQARKRETNLGLATGQHRANTSNREPGLLSFRSS